MMKRTPGIIRLLPVPGIMLLTALACAPEMCLEETDAFVKASFYLTSTSLQVKPDSLTLFGSGESKKVYNDAKNPSGALIPLNSSTGSCSFIIRINGVSDTLAFTYTSFPYLVSKECGYSFCHEIDTPKYSKNIIDKVITIRKTITTINEENLRIYY